MPGTQQSPGHYSLSMPVCVRCIQRSLRHMRDFSVQLLRMVSGIVNMEQLMIPALDEVGIDALDEGVGITALDGVGAVGGVETVGTGLPGGVAGNGLTAAVYAAAGACHDLNEIIADLLGKKLLNELACVCKAACDCNAKLALAEGNAELLDAFKTADAAVADSGDGVMGLFGGYAAEDCLGNAAGCAEDNAAAGEHTEGCIDSLGCDVFEVNACGLYHADKLLGGENGIDLGLAVMLELLAVCLELLGGAGHYGKVEVVHAVVLLALDDDGGQHVHGRTAGGDIGHDLGILCFNKADPAGAAGGEHGHSKVLCVELEEFCGLFHDGKVCADGGVIDPVYADPMQRSNDLAHDIGTLGHAELFAERNADCGSDLSGDKGVLVGDSVPDLVDILLDGDRAYGADCRALTAADAGGISDGLFEGGADEHMGSAVCIVDSTDGLNLVAHPYTLAAEDALAGVAGDADGGIVPLILGGVGETYIGNAVTLCQLLELAAAALGAGWALNAVVCKQQLNDVPAILAEPCGVGVDDHTVTGLSGAGSVKTAALVLKHAQAACAVDGEVGVIAKGGHIDAGLADYLKNGLFAVELNTNTVDCHELLFH